MVQHQFLKPIAQAVVVLVFALVIAGPIGVVGHAHQGGEDHAAFHSTLGCVWMCAASAFVGPEGNVLAVSFTVGDGATSEPAILLLRNLPKNFQPRAPPLFL
tara:strand:- start:177 stop:482 length:306 start_codon:yes stop_codon:yes gene_type:complete